MLFSLLSGLATVAPAASAAAIDTPEDSAATTTVVVTAEAGAAAPRFRLVRGPERGRASVDAASGVVSFVPADNRFGADSCVVEVKVGDASTRVTIPIVVQAVNDAPSVEAMILQTQEEQAIGLPLTIRDVDSKAFAFSVLTPPGHGNATVDARGRVRYTPAVDHHGADRFVIAVNDNSGAVVEAPVDVVIAAVNDAPVVKAAGGRGNEDEDVVVVVEAADVDGDALTFVVSKDPAHGSARVDANGRVTFTPAANWSGSDGASVTVKDRSSQTTAQVSFTLTPQNDAPVVEAMTLALREDSAASAPLTVKDIDGDVAQFAIGTAPAKGIASVDAKGRVSFTPARDQNGTLRFVVAVTDGHGGSALAPVDVVITPVNDTPTVKASALVGDEDDEIVTAVVAADVDGDALTFAVGRGPAHGSARIDNAGRLSFVPTANWSGKDSVVVTVSDTVSDGGLSATTEVPITLAPKNDLPTVEPMTLRLREDESASLPLTVRDIDGDGQRFSILTAPTAGSASVDAKGRVAFTPARDQNGAAAFVVGVDDGHGTVVKAPVDVVIAAVNDAPVIDDARARGREDEVAGIDLVGRDVDGDLVTWSIDRQPLHGTATIDARSGRLQVTPGRDWHGNDVVTVVLSDQKTQTRRELALDFAAQNDAPVVEAMILSTREEAPVSLPLTVRDIDGDAVTFAVGRAPQRGTATVDAKGRVSFKPAPDENGADSFTVVVSDGVVGVDAPIDVVIAAVNDAPVATAAKLTVDEDATLDARIGGTDVDGDALVVTVVRAPPGAFSLKKSGELLWTPPKDWHGTEKLSFEVDDGRARSRADIELKVAPTNDAPTLQLPALKTAEDREGGVTATASDIDGDTLRFSVITPGKKGVTTVDAVTGALRYRPSADENGDDVVVVAVADGTTRTEGRLTVNLTPEVDAPRVPVQSWTVREDETTTMTLAAKDVDGDALVFTLVGGTEGTAKGSAKHGVARLVDDRRGVFSWTPNLNENGSDEIRFEVAKVSGVAGKVAGVLNVVVAPVNDAPTSTPLSLSTTEDRAVRGSVVFSDIDGDRLKLAVVGDTPHARVDVIDASAGVVAITPEADYHGDITVNVRAVEVQTGGLTGAPTTIKVAVAGENDRPVASHQSVRTPEDVAADIVLVAKDVDADALRYRLERAPTLGSVTVDERTGRARYVGRKNVSGADRFSFVVSDGKLEAAAVVDVDVAAVDDAPLAQESQLLSPRAGRVTGMLLARDPEGATLTFRILDQPNLGRVTLLDEHRGAFAFSAPGGQQYGRTTFTFVVDDGTNTSTPATVTVDVQ